MHVYVNVADVCPLAIEGLAGLKVHVLPAAESVMLVAAVVAGLAVTVTAADATPLATGPTPASVTSRTSNAELVTEAPLKAASAVAVIVAPAAAAAQLYVNVAKLLPEEMESGDDGVKVHDAAPVALREIETAAEAAGVRFTFTVPLVPPLARCAMAPVNVSSRTSNAPLVPAALL